MPVLYYHKGNTEKQNDYIPSLKAAKRDKTPWLARLVLKSL
jgi:hypothetical protein